MRRLEFDPGQVHVRFWVVKVATAKVFIFYRSIPAFPVSIIPSTLHTQLHLQTVLIRTSSRRRETFKVMFTVDILPTRCNITQFIYFWETALRVSGGIFTHHHEHTQLYLQYLVLVKPLLLPAANVERLELV